MARKTLLITSADLFLSEVTNFINNGSKIKIDKQVRDKIEKSHNIITQIIEDNQPVYGVNTGFGKFSDVRISRDKLAELQKRLVYSHAAGTGEPIDRAIVRLILLLKIKSLSLGYSGCRFEVIKQLIDMLNHDILPVILYKIHVHGSGSRR